MKGIAILSRAKWTLPTYNTSGYNKSGYIKSSDYALIGDMRLQVVEIEIPEPDFNRTGLAFRGKVLLRKKAFSLNFRDRRQILLAAASDRANGFYVVGSDFCAEVVETADDVNNLKPGDRVIANNCYPESGSGNSHPGVVTNHASKEYEVVPAGKLMLIPDALDDIQAAGFSIGAQTVYGMLRRLEPEAGSRFLILAGRSNTALFAIAAFRTYGVRLSVTTTSPALAARFAILGAERVYVLPRREEPFSAPEELTKSCRDEGGFHCVIDPFFDLHFPGVLHLMATGGKYISCGVFAQGPCSQPGISIDRESLVRLLVGNLHCMGNCLGSTADLRRAIEDARTGTFRVPVDSVFSGDSAGAFLERTFNDPARFGKVIYRYD